MRWDIEVFFGLGFYYSTNSSITDSASVDNEYIFFGATSFTFSFFFMSSFFFVYLIIFFSTFYGFGSCIGV